MKQCIARKVYALTTDAPTDEDLIEFADSHSINEGNGGLDSLDLGDSMGYFISLVENAERESEYGWGGGDECIFISPEGFIVTIASTWESFQWGESND